MVHYERKSVCSPLKSVDQSRDLRQSGKSKGILNPQGFARVLTKGKGKGQLYSTLAKPLPLPRVEGYWKGTARVLIHKCI